MLAHIFNVSFCVVSVVYIFFFYSRLENHVLLVPEKAASRLLLSLSLLPLLLLSSLLYFSFFCFITIPFQVPTKFNGHCIVITLMMMITMNVTNAYASQLRFHLKCIARVQFWPIFLMFHFVLYPRADQSIFLCHIQRRF